ncbi:hypothetical protein A4H97_33240 [Niastella yeongjuensis]|uniref:Uncharacterized protein n=1 Tax=Niastella yeongjuensis TaxID=354355 RepID=A0A1V9EFW9_9BACT|nr:hypothetical protein [Niastella yeongjuensis]OQP45028.1 hypothetical protein A4H97_33240 [Niastella yeongjuensis]SEP49021.1 hypothetical protein SAMN05660816_06864 [Niastella yeongjuensis]
MNLKYLIIGVRDTNIQKLETFLNEEGKVFELSNVDVTIEDVRDDLLMVKKFLIENDLKDDDPFFNEFDMMPYSLQVDFTVVPSYKYLLVLESYVFSLAQMISATLKVECLVMFENMRMPIGLFKEGVLIDTFHNYNSEFFKSRYWRPSAISINFTP